MYTFKKYYLCHALRKNDFEPMRKLLVAIVGVFIFGFSAFAQRPDLPGHLIFDIGINSWSKVPVGAEMNVFKSKTVNILYYFDLPIGNGGVTFTPGIGLGLERYAFDNNTTLTTSIDNSGVRTVGVGQLETIHLNSRSFDKTKLATNYLDIPLELRYYASENDYSRGFRVALGPKIGILYSSFTKVKLEDELRDTRILKDKQSFGLNKFRYGIQARVGWAGFSLFGYYELSDKFEIFPPGAQNTRTVTFGITLTGF